LAGDFQELETQQSQEGSRALVFKCFGMLMERGGGLGWLLSVSFLEEG